MQHTNKYNLNIIETTDAFGPEPLNENTRTLEAQLDAVRGEFAAADAAETAARETALSALSGRMGTLETGRLLWKLGTYTGSGKYGYDSRNRLEFDFKPIAIVICNPSNAFFGGRFWVRGSSEGFTYSGISASYSSYITWGDRAIEWCTSDNNADAQLNRANIKYAYLALGTES